MASSLQRCSHDHRPESPRHPRSPVTTIASERAPAM
jgi:hypothetical protein